MQLAQLNIAEATAKMNILVMAVFLMATNRIKAIAEENDLFVWRLVGDYNDDLYLINVFDCE